MTDEHRGTRSAAYTDDVAAAFLDALGPMDAMKLQKLVYYAQAWHAATGQGPLIGHRIEAWAQGPVVRYLFNKHRGRWLVTRWPDGSAEALAAPARATVADVARRYGHMTGDQLSRLTHREAPWTDARGGLDEGARSSGEIPVAAMADYYARQVAAPRDAVAHAVANAALEGVVVPDDHRQVLTAIADGTADVETVVADLVRHYSHAG